MSGFSQWIYVNARPVLTIMNTKEQIIARFPRAGLGLIIELARRIYTDKLAPFTHEV